MDDIRAITLRQPYPSLVARRLKRWETRSWKTSYRGPLAIHAAVRWEPGWRGVWVDPDRDGPELERYDILVEQLGLEPNEDVNGSGWWSAWDGGLLPVGAVVAVVQLTDCLPIIDARNVDAEPPAIEVWPDGTLSLWEPSPGVPGVEPVQEHDISDQIPYGHWEPGGWAWQLEDVWPLAEPIPAKGRQGLWRPDPDLAATVTERNQP